MQINNIIFIIIFICNVIQTSGASPFNKKKLVIGQQSDQTEDQQKFGKKSVDQSAAEEGVGCGRAAFAANLFMLDTEDYGQWVDDPNDQTMFTVDELIGSIDWDMMPQQSDEMMPTAADQTTCADLKSDSSLDLLKQGLSEDVKPLIAVDQASSSFKNFANQNGMKCDRMINYPIGSAEHLASAGQEPCPKRHKITTDDKMGTEQLDFGSYITVVEIEQFFWRIMLAFGILPEQLNEQQLLDNDFGTIIRQQTMMANAVVEQFKQQLLFEDCFIDKQILQRIDIQTIIVFGTSLFDIKTEGNEQKLAQNNNEEKQEKLFFYTFRLLRMLLGFLDAPYGKNFQHKKGEGKKTSERETLKNKIKVTRKKMMQEFSKSIKRNCDKKLKLTSKFDLLDTIFEIIELAMFGIEVLIAPLIGEEIFNHKKMNDFFANLEQIGRKKFAKILVKSNDFGSAHIVEASKMYRQTPYFKHRLGIFITFNAIVEEAADQTHWKASGHLNAENLVMTNAKMYKEIFTKILNFFQPHLVEAVQNQQKLHQIWNTTKNFIEICVKQFEGISN